MYIVGLTGGIACGKSTVSNILRDFGACIIDADEIAREIVQPGKDAYIQIVQQFGFNVLQSDGQIDRSKLGNIVFSDYEEKKKLDCITHPIIKRKMQDRLVEAKLAGYKIAVLDVPLLIENGWQNECADVWVVTVEPETQIKRLLARNGGSREAALARINSQMPMEQKLKYADVIIDNNAEIADTRVFVQEILKNLF